MTCRKGNEQPLTKSSPGVSCGAVDAADGSVAEVVVAGGIWYTDKVEIYDVAGGAWRDGGKEELHKKACSQVA